MTLFLQQIPIQYCKLLKIYNRIKILSSATQVSTISFPFPLGHRRHVAMIWNNKTLMLSIYCPSIAQFVFIFEPDPILLYIPILYDWIHLSLTDLNGYLSTNIFSFIVIVRPEETDHRHITTTSLQSLKRSSSLTKIRSPSSRNIIHSLPYGILVKQVR